MGCNAVELATDCSYTFTMQDEIWNLTIMDCTLDTWSIARDIRMHQVSY